MTRSQRSLSFLKNAANSAGVSVTTTAPSPLIRSTVSGRDKDLRISPESLLMIAALNLVYFIPELITWLPQRMKLGA